jgi:MOSC domain-containing protein YiiM
VVRERPEDGETEDRGVARAIRTVRAPIRTILRVRRSSLDAMKLLAVNIGRPRRVVYEGREIETGIFKQPVKGQAVWLQAHHLEGDAQADRRVHGGPDKAVYVYPVEHYAYWAQVLGRQDLAPGFFGENFTVAGLCEETVLIGDVFRVGEAVVEVTQPRTPCFKLDLRVGEAGFAARFSASLRCGWYLRVLQPGRVRAGDEIERLACGAGGMSVREVFRLKTDPQADLEALARAANLPALAVSWRAAFEKRLARQAAAAAGE